MSLSSVLQQFVVSLPLLVVYVLGLGLAVSQISRLPRVALAAGGSFAVLLMMTLVRPLLYWLMAKLMQDVGGPGLDFGYILMNLVLTLLEAAAMGALIYAIFADRPQTGLPTAQQQWPPKAI
jgi:hypothetical protein